MANQSQKVEYTTPSGFSQKASDAYHYSAAVHIPGNPNVVKISGQGGWDPETGKVDDVDIPAQFDQAFANVDRVLKAAGSKGWEDVYLVRAFLLPPKEGGTVAESIGICGDALRKWCPDKRPLLTAVGTSELGLPEMKIEVEVEAYVGAEVELEDAAEAS